MKILFDHCTPRRLRRLLAAHLVRTSAEMGWDALRNGLLLDQAEAGGFEVLLTVDQNLRYQQNLTGRTVSVVVMVALSNKYTSLVPLIPQVEAVLLTLQPGQLYEVRLPPTPPLPPPIP